MRSLSLVIGNLLIVVGVIALIVIAVNRWRETGQQQSHDLAYLEHRPVHQDLLTRLYLGIEVEMDELTQPAIEDLIRHGLLERAAGVVGYHLTFRGSKVAERLQYSTKVRPVCQ